jgi:ABC-type glutathione transport system ATPase component
MTAAAQPVLSITDLQLEFTGRAGPVAALGGINLSVARREIVGIVGESGSGKSVTALSVMGLLPRGKAHITAGEIRFNDQNLLNQAEPALRRLRGRDMTMIFQEPMTALNPVKRVSQQLLEVIQRLDDGLAADAARQRALRLLNDMHVSDAERVFNAYPHELSGGLRQRVLIAMAFASDPALLIADEPTTALDVTTQAQILALLEEKARQHGTSVIFISHDLAVVAHLCDRVYIMSQGQVVESGPTVQVIRSPRAAYTRRLLNANPEGKTPRTRFTTASAAQPGTPVARRAISADELLQLDRITVEYGSHGGLRRGQGALRAVDNVSLGLKAGETLSIVGESGSGKTTLAKAVVGLVPLTAGTLTYRGQTLGPRRDLTLKRDMQMIFQDPQSSLNPRHRAWRIVTEPARIALSLSRRACRDRAQELLNLVGLDASYVDRLPHEFSGGERQRLAIARALSVQPKLLVLDEPTSALDVSVQAQILNLLLDLQDDQQLSYLFISHDVAVVRHMSDRVAVMHHGSVVESGDAERVLEHPEHDYTRALIASVPTLAECVGA